MNNRGEGKSSIFGASWEIPKSIEKAEEAAKMVQIPAYWMGASNVILGLSAESVLEMTIGASLVIMGILVWRRYFSLVPVVGAICILLGVMEMFIRIIYASIPGLFLSTFLIGTSIYSIVWGWLALRRINSKGSSPIESNSG